MAWATRDDLVCPEMTLETVPFATPSSRDSWAGEVPCLRSRALMSSRCICIIGKLVAVTSKRDKYSDLFLSSTQVDFCHMGRHLQKPVCLPLARLMASYDADTFAALAVAVPGLTESTVRNWHKRDRVPDQWLRLASEQKGVPFDWISGQDAQKKFGQGGKPVSQLVSEPEPNMGHSHHVVHEDAGFVVRSADGEAVQFYVIPRYEGLTLSADTGVEVADGLSLIGDIAVSPEWMRKNLGRAGSGFVIVAVASNSMEPTLAEGSSVIVDRKRIDIDGDGIYALRRDRDLLVKRLQKKLNGKLMVISDNPLYPPEELREEDAENLAVIGRVVWPPVR